MLVSALKLIGCVLLVAILLVAAGLTGILFRLWPTSWPDTTLQVTPEGIDRLRTLRATPKFYPDASTYYPGASSEGRRALDERLVNAMLDSLVGGLERRPRKSFVLSKFKSAMAVFPTDDSEDMDRLCGYLEQVLDTLGIDGSNELLNVWRYGLPYGWVVRPA